MNKKILITGGCGFVGRHLTKRLSKNKNNKITIVDDLSTGLRLEKWPEHLKCKVDKILYKDCIDYFKSTRNHFDIIFHLAAIVEGRISIEQNPLQVAKDLSIDAELFNWCIKTKPSKLVYFSSSAVYPIKLQSQEYNVPLKEEFIDFKNNVIDIPDMSYGWSKLTGEFLSHLAVTKYNLHVAIYRPFSGYGEDQAFSYPFPAILRRIINKENPINVWGTGEQSRDFIYIEDCISGVLETYENINDASAINLGTGIKTSFKELIKLACEVNNVDYNIRTLLNKPTGVYARYSDTSKQHKLGFIPRYSLKGGIKIVSDYLKKQI